MNSKQKIKKRIVLGMLLGIVISFMSYSYAIASTTFSVSRMEMKNNEIADLQTEIAELELEYFTIINDVSVGNTEIYGLKQVQVVGYVSIDKDTRVAYNY